MLSSPREANMLRLNAKHIEVLKPHVLIMLATEQHSSGGSSSAPPRFSLFPTRTALINAKKRLGNYVFNKDMVGG